MKTLQRSITLRIGLVCAAALLGCDPNCTAQAGINGSKVAPPNSKPRGHTLAEWSSQWFARGFTGGWVPEVAGHVLFTYSGGEVTGSGTLEDPWVFTSHGDFTVKAGTAFVTPLLFWPTVGSNPVLPEEWFGTYVTLEEDLVIDGQTVITQQDICDFYVAPQYYDPPLASSVRAVQGWWVFCEPLAVGVHEVSFSTAERFPADNGLFPEFGQIIRVSYTITVVP